MDIEYQWLETVIRKVSIDKYGLHMMMNGKKLFKLKNHQASRQIVIAQKILHKISRVLKGFSYFPSYLIKRLSYWSCYAICKCPEPIQQRFERFHSQGILNCGTTTKTNADSSNCWQEYKVSDTKLFFNYDRF